MQIEVTAELYKRMMNEFVVLVTAVTERCRAGMQREFEVGNVGRGRRGYN